MKTKQLLFGLFLIPSLILSCSESKTDNEESEGGGLDVTDIEQIDFDDVEMTDDVDDYLMTCINVHNAVNPMPLPYDEKMSYDIYDPYFPLSAEEIYAFKLDTLGVDTNMFVNLDYWVDLSPDFSTYVFNVELNEHELATYMVTYFGDYSYIDSKMIAYDEAAESANRIESKIEKDLITIDNISYWEDEEHKIEKFYIDENGNFQEK